MREPRRRSSGLRRPILKPGLARLERAADSVQFGARSDRAVVVTDLDAAARTFLAQLDGLIEQADLAPLATACGLPIPRAADLISRLDGSGVLTDAAAACAGWTELPASTRDRLRPDLIALALGAPDPSDSHQGLTRRFAACVVVEGAGRVGAAVAALLGVAGVGRVQVRAAGLTRPQDLSPAGLRADALGRAREVAACPDALPESVRHAARTRLGLDPDQQVEAVDLLILTTDQGRAPEPASADPDVVPRLYAAVAENTGCVGPLVLPGRTSCLRCHDLFRAERDPDWPALAAQLSDPPDTVAACDVVLATAVATHAALQALAFLDLGSAATLDGTLHLRMPEGEMRRRSWQPHPACGCTWA